jgi:hypothetical protein
MRSDLFLTYSLDIFYGLEKSGKKGDGCSSSKKGFTSIVGNPLDEKAFGNAGRRNRTTDTGIFSLIRNVLKEKLIIQDLTPFSTLIASRGHCSSQFSHSIHSDSFTTIS